MDDPQSLVSTEWLAAHLDDPDLCVLDASWYLPDQNREAKAEYAEAHIPGAQFVDLDAISDRDSPLPHMAPPAEEFAAEASALGAGDGARVVVYDGAGLFSAARVWWLFRHMGKRDVAVLDGGFPKWRAEGRPVEQAAPALRKRPMTDKPRAEMVTDIAGAAEAAASGAHEVVDARAPARFRGETPEPRPELRAGHIPGSKNLHYAELLNDDGTMKDPAALRALFAAAGVDLDKPVVTTCGSGVTAAILYLALERMGHTQHALYDGSWSEWGASDRDVARG